MISNLLLNLFTAIFITSFLYSQPLKIFDLVLEVNKNLHKYGFIIESDTNSTSNNFIIKIYNAESNKLIQLIDMKNYSPYEYAFIDSLTDINFDGFKDLLVAHGNGQNGKNQSFDIFLFDKLKSKFYKNPFFRAIYNPQVNGSLKCVYEFFWSGTCTIDCIILNTYKVLNKKLTLIQSEYNEYDPKTNIMRSYVEKFKNGKSVSKKVVGVERNKNGLE